MRPDYYDLSKYDRLEQLIADMPHFIGAAMKYLRRAGHKDGNSQRQDVEKALECLKIQLEHWDEQRMDIIGQNGNTGEHYAHQSHD